MMGDVPCPPKLRFGTYFARVGGFLALEPCRTPVFLRPKRFGKSIVCSMLAHYYDVNLKDRFEKLFGKTDIGREPTPLHGILGASEEDIWLVIVRLRTRYWH